MRSLVVKTTSAVRFWAGAPARADRQHPAPKRTGSPGQEQTVAASKSGRSTPKVSGAGARQGGGHQHRP